MMGCCRERKSALVSEKNPRCFCLQENVFLLTTAPWIFVYLASIKWAMYSVKQIYRLSLPREPRRISAFPQGNHASFRPRRLRIRYIERKPKDFFLLPCPKDQLAEKRKRPARATFHLECPQQFTQ